MTDQLCPGCPGDPNETCCKPELRVKVWMDKQKADMADRKAEQKTLRDEFAMAALQGLLAQSLGTALGSDPVYGARYAWAMADAMMAERAARTQEARHG